MNTALVVIAAVVVLGVLAFFLVSRGKGAAQPTLEGGEPNDKDDKKAPLPAASDKPAAKAQPKAEPPPEPRAEPKAEPKRNEVLDAPESTRATDDAEKPSVEVRPSRAPRDLGALKKGLGAARKGFFGRLADLLSGKKEIDPGIVAEMEEIMLTSDVGPKTTQGMLERLQSRLSKKELVDADAVLAALKQEAKEILAKTPSKPLALDGKPSVLLMVGVNGVGKTTTIGKLATRFTANGKKVMLGAGDTFRAAAVAQLEVWGKRVGAEVWSGKEGADPGAVAFEATNKAKEAGVDVLMIDTAGRLHTKTPLMDEIKKVRKTTQKAIGDAPHETLLVLDATTGQNAMNQAALFKEAIPLTGIVLTKLDGTAKGGIVLAIAEELGVPVRYIGLGERAEDLREFDADDFIEALFSRDDA
jgi:fused signal recognition particle receptor